MSPPHSHTSSSLLHGMPVLPGICHRAAFNKELATAGLMKVRRKIQSHVPVPPAVWLKGVSEVVLCGMRGMYPVTVVFPGFALGPWFPNHLLPPSWRKKHGNIMLFVLLSEGQVERANDSPFCGWQKDFSVRGCIKDSSVIYK